MLDEWDQALADAGIVLPAAAKPKAKRCVRKRPAAVDLAESPRLEQSATHPADAASGIGAAIVSHESLTKLKKRCLPQVPDIMRPYFGNSVAENRWPLINYVVAAFNSCTEDGIHFLTPAATAMKAMFL